MVEYFHDSILESGDLLSLAELRQYAGTFSELRDELADLWRTYLSSFVGVPQEDVIDQEPHLAPNPEFSEEFKACKSLEDFEALGKKMGIDYTNLENDTDDQKMLSDKWKPLISQLGRPN